MSRILVNEIKAMLELRLSLEQIADRLCISTATVKQAVEILKK
jgi:DNA-binding CsgD family transcriptional regulator